MSDIKNWSQTDASNTDSTKSGMPEGMPRSDVNNRARERMGALRRWYEDAEWVNLISEHLADFTATRLTDTSIRISDSGGTNATSKFPVGSHVKLVFSSSTVYAEVLSTPGYSGGNLDITLTAMVDGAWATVAALPAGAITSASCFISRRIRSAAFRKVGITRSQTPTQIPDIDSLGTHVSKGEGHDPEGDGSNGIDADLLDGQHKSYFDARDAAEYPNMLINGSFNVWQRGTTIDGATVYDNDDGSYCADRWLLLSDGNDKVDLTRQAAGVIQFKNALKAVCVNTTAGAGNAEKFGLAQIVESVNIYPALSEAKASLSFYAKTSVGSDITRLRCAILEKTSGTADSFTSSTRDVVSAWGAENVSPTLSTGWAYAGGSASDVLSLTSTWTKFTMPNITISSSAVNLAAFIWIDDTSHSDADELWLSAVQLQSGGTASEYHHVPFDRELQACERYFEKTYDLDVSPGTVTKVGAVSCTTYNIPGPVHHWSFRQRMHAAPTVTSYGTATGTAGKWTLYGGDPAGSAGSDANSVLYDVGESSVWVSIVTPGTNWVKTHLTAEAEL